MRIPVLPCGGFVFSVGTPVEDAVVGFSDGSVKKGRAAYGSLLFDSTGTGIEKQCARLDGVVRDSNVPELRGLEAVIDMAIAHGKTALVCLLDSFQAVECLGIATSRGVYRYPEVARILKKAAALQYFEARNIENKYNKQADALARSPLM